MADIDDTDATEGVRLIGADPSTGDEQTPVKSSASGDLATSDVLDIAGVNASLTVGLTAVELKVGGSPLADRKYVIFQSQDNGVYFGFSNGVTTSNGIKIFKDQLLMMPIGDGVSFWFIADGAGKDVRIAEVS